MTGKLAFSVTQATFLTPCLITDTALYLTTRCNRIDYTSRLQPPGCTTNPHVHIANCTQLFFIIADYIQYENIILTHRLSKILLACFCVKFCQAVCISFLSFLVLVFLKFA